MQNNLYIPKKIKVGFQKRSDTFTGKLAYVIYFDDKGVLRKEGSWNGWCDKTIPSVEFDNVPTKFLFNKGVDRNGHFGSGRSLMRVYDERDFEFEISIDNLVGILMHSDISKRDIVEPCVLAWSGKDLVLLPVNSDAYQASMAYTQKQGEKVSSKNLVKGYSYTQKKSDTPLTYIGYYSWWEWESDKEDDSDQSYYYGSVRNHYNKGKKHIFYDGSSFRPFNVANLSSVCSGEVCENYADLVDAFFKIEEASPAVKYELVDAPIKKLGQYSNYYLYTLENSKLLGLSVSNYQSCRLDSLILESATNTIIVDNKLQFKRDDSGIHLAKRDRNYYGFSRSNSITASQASHIKKLKELADSLDYMQPYLNSDNRNQIPVDIAVKFLAEAGFKFLVVQNELGCKFDHRC